MVVFLREAELISRHNWLQHQLLIWASPWDYDTCHISDQRRLRWACTSAQSCQSLCCSHTWSMEVDERADQTSDIQPHWVAAYAHLKNEFTEDEKYHNLMGWLILEPYNPSMPSRFFYSFHWRGVLWTFWFFILHVFSIEVTVCKQCRPWSDALFCGVWSGSALFANVLFMEG